MIEYKVEVNKRFKHARVYRIQKRINDNTNFLSRRMQSFVDKYLLKRQKVQ